MSADPSPRARALVVSVRTDDDGETWVTAPGVGLWHGLPADGEWITPGCVLGALEVLGERRPLLAPEGLLGQVRRRGGAANATGLGQGAAIEPNARRGAVDFGMSVFAVARADAANAIESADAATTRAQTGSVFRAPTSGRYYGRPGPGQAAFCAVGDVITVGQTVALLEVMKTFNRVQYDGRGLPARARVVAILAAEESDVEQGAPILELADADGSVADGQS